MARRSNEPFIWSLFSAGGVMAALFVPVLLLLFGLAFPLRWIEPLSYEKALSLVHSPWTRLGLFVLCSLCLFHGAHRLRFTLYDGLQIKHLNELIFLLCYGSALAGMGIAGWLLWWIF